MHAESSRSISWGHGQTAALPSACVTTTPDAARVLDAVDALSDQMLLELRDVLRIPSVSGTDAENDAQQHMGDVLGRGGMEVDLWLATDQPAAFARTGRPVIAVDLGKPEEAASVIVAAGRAAPIPTSPAWRSTAVRRGDWWDDWPEATPIPAEP